MQEYASLKIFFSGSAKRFFELKFVELINKLEKNYEILRSSLKTIFTTK